MSEREILIRACIVEAFDVAPLHAYVDYLQEQGLIGPMMAKVLCRHTFDYFFTDELEDNYYVENGLAKREASPMIAYKEAMRRYVNFIVGILTHSKVYRLM